MLAYILLFHIWAFVFFSELFLLSLQNSPYWYEWDFVRKKVVSCNSVHQQTLGSIWIVICWQ